MSGAPPLQGIKVLEFAGLAPGPFAGMQLADAGASVLRIDRIPGISTDVLSRRKTSLAVDLKNPQGIALIKQIIASAPIDVLIDPFRPGVLEKLGLGPDVLLSINPRLVYGRMTGFRRDGKYAAMAGHDINYLAVSGALSMLGRAGQNPHPPINILGDFAGGGANLYQGVLLALLARERTGRGQVVEANMVDGASYLTTFPRLMRHTPMGHKERGTNVLDGGCPWYDTYQTRDGGYMSVGALEPQFFTELMKGLGLANEGWDDKRADEDLWPELKRIMTGIFLTKTRAEWEKVFDGTDACCAPVISYGEMEEGTVPEADQRPSVTLRDTPCLALDREHNAAGDATAAARGQGAGIEGGSFMPSLLEAGEGGDKTLGDWLGWTAGKQFQIGERGAVLVAKSKL